MKPEDALQRFVGDNPELEQLEALLSEFNVFEAIGVSRQELRHSDFLGFLLTPSQSHGLSDYFTKRLMHRIVAGSTIPLSFSSIDIDSWPLQDLEVRREWHNIDLLLISPSNRLVVAIENKVDAGEHSNQLERYRSTVSRLFRGWHQAFVFVSRFGGHPSDPAYVPIGYSEIAHLLAQTLTSRSAVLDPSVRIVMDHYVKLLRRHVVEDSQVAEWCRRIYQRHRQAIDLILEHRLSTRDELYSYLMELIAADERFIEDGSTPQYIRFALPEWDSPAMFTGHGWTSTGRMLLLEFTNVADQVTFDIVVGPGKPDVRNVLIDAARMGPHPFDPPRGRLRRWVHLYGAQQVLAPEEYETASLAMLRDRIDAWWRQFLETELAVIRETMAPAIEKLHEIDTTNGVDKHQESPHE